VVDRQFVDDIIGLTGEEVVLLYRDDDVKIARRAAADTGIAFAGHPDTVTVIDAGGYFDRDTPLVFLIAGPPAIVAGVGNDSPFAVAL
jgi:hypothetical protein